MKLKKEIEVFIEGARKYFNHLTLDEDEVKIGTPFLASQDEPLGMDYTGMIAIGGNARGAVFFSASKVLLKYILLSHSETRLNDRYMRDIAGEVANTIAGNARLYLGSDFHISPPRVLSNQIDGHHLNTDTHCYVIPLRWRNNGAQLLVSLSSNPRNHL